MERVQGDSTETWALPFPGHPMEVVKIGMKVAGYLVKVFWRKSYWSTISYLSKHFMLK